MLTEEIAWQDRCHAAEGERDNARANEQTLGEWLTSAEYTADQLRDLLVSYKRQRDSSARWAKAWKQQATAWRYSWIGADLRAQAAWAQTERNRVSAEAEVARLTAERDKARRWAKAWRHSAKYNRDWLETFLAGWKRDQAELGKLKAQLANHVEADTRAAEAGLRVDQRQVRLERVVSAAREMLEQDAGWLLDLHFGTDFSEGGRKPDAATDQLRKALADLDAWEDSRRQEAGG